MTYDKDRLTLAAYLAEYLSFSMKREDAERAAVGLSRKYGTLGVLFSSSLDELASTEGMNDQSALSVKLLGYIYSRSVTDSFKLGRVHTEEEIREYFTALFLGLSIETVYCLSLDERGRAVASDYLGEGTVNSTEIYPRRVLECASRNRAKSIILAHNHPKGTVCASAEDKAATEYIKCVLRDAGIKLVAHYLVSDGKCAEINTYLNT